MKTLSKIELNTVSGGESEGVNWWRAGFDVTAFGIVGGGIGAITLGCYAGYALASPPTGTLADGFSAVFQMLGACSGAAVGGFGGFILGSLVGATVAAGREIYSGI